MAPTTESATVTLREVVPSPPSGDDDERHPAFPIFKELPLEIRLLIWESALPPPRIIEIHLKRLKMTPEEWNIKHAPEVDLRTGVSHPACWSTLHFYSAMYGIKSDHPLPSILLVCRESYEHASKYLVRAFTTTASPVGTYINLSCDYVYLRWETFKREFPGPFWFALHYFADRANMFRVQNLVLEITTKMTKIFDRDLTLEQWITDVLKHFLGVKHLTIVVRHYASSKSVDYHFMEPIAFDKTLEEVYSKFQSSPTDLKDMPEEIYLDAQFATVDPAAVVTRLSWLGRKPELKEQVEAWKLPEIDYKIVVDSGQLETINEARETCRKAIKQATNNRNA